MRIWIVAVTVASACVSTHDHEDAIPRYVMAGLAAKWNSAVKIQRSDEAAMWQTFPNVADNHGMRLALHSAWAWRQHIMRGTDNPFARLTGFRAYFCGEDVVVWCSGKDGLFETDDDEFGVSVDNDEGIRRWRKAHER